ncbi:MAG: hypothetical protein AAGA03_09270, partial [Planctomycetota bacterium]
PSHAVAEKSILQCQEALHWPAQDLDPPPLIDGQRLQELGLTPGPSFRRLLQQIRDQQLDGQLVASEQAEKFAIENADD